ncbi:MAG: hypothetical protein R3C14_05770 [Caldilineaceae bacterium]
MPLALVTAQWLTLPLAIHALNTCYAVADEGDRLVSLDKTDGTTSDIGGTGVQDIEAIAFAPSSAILYAANADTLGTIDIITGKFTAIGLFGTGNGVAGLAPLQDVDSLSWNLATNILYGVSRREIDEATGQALPDVLFQIDSATGAFRPGVFAGADYVVVGVTSKDEADIDDIAFDPVTGILYGIANSGGEGGTLVIIDPTTGAITEIGPMSDASDPSNVIDDMEGLAFFNDGQLYGSTGNFTITESNRLYRIDKATGLTTLVGPFPSNYRDYEALDCLTAMIADDDDDGIVNSGEDVNHDNNLANDDSDADTIPNYLDTDDDGDQVPTIDEDVNHSGNPLDDDTDHDGIANYLDIDDDNDGVNTSAEDSNLDGNPANDDADADTIPDYLEGGDTDGDTIANQLDSDDDNDTIATQDEDVNQDGSLFNDDTDRDKIPNYLDDDDDGDGIPTKLEDVDGDGDPRNDNADGDRVANYLDDDDDNDGIPTKAEDLNLDGNYFNDDSDKDGVPDWLDPDLPELPILYLPLILQP